MFCSGYPKDFTRTKVDDNAVVAAFGAEWEERERRACEINMSNLHTPSNLLTDMIVQIRHNERRKFDSIMGQNFTKLSNVRRLA